MTEDKISQELRFKKIDEARNFFLEEMKHHYFMSKKHKKVCMTLDSTRHFLISLSTISGCVSVSAFDLLVGIPIVIVISAVGLKICAISAGIKKCTSVIKKKRKKA